MSNKASRPWEYALDVESLALPVSFSLFVAGIAGYFGGVSLMAFVLMLLAAVCLQLSANLARAYGDIVDRESVRRDYYERKFAQYKMRKELDPVAATAGNLLAMQLRTMLIATTAMGLVLGYAFIMTSFGMDVSSTGADAIPFARQWMAFALYAVVVALVLLRYLGTWRHGYRVYGNIILFVLVGGCATGCFYLLAHAFVFVVIYPSIGIGALAVAIANMRDISRMETDSELRQSNRARRTIPLALRFEGALMLQVVAVILAMVWLLVFPIMMDAPFIWNYAFVLFYIPLVRELVMLRSIKPSGVARAKRALALASIFLSAAWLFSLAASNLSLAFMLFVL